LTYLDSGYVRRQYRDASKLNTRIALHARFSPNPYGLQSWIFDHLELQDKASVLDVGRGPGPLWKENRDRLPERWNVTLTDASPGMVSEAEGSLGADRRFVFRVGNVQHLPFERESFNAVVANHMLYHVPYRSKANSGFAYLLSGPAGNGAAGRTADGEFERRVSDLVGRLEQELASRGTIGITKDTGLFVARK
jgi:SAM-dependent methyltransferase